MKTAFAYKTQELKRLDHFAKPAKLSSNSIPWGPHGPALLEVFQAFRSQWRFGRSLALTSHTAVGGVVRHRSVNAGPNPNPREGSPSLKHTSHSQQNPWRKPWASTPSTQNPREGKKILSSPATRAGGGRLGLRRRERGEAVNRAGGQQLGGWPWWRGGMVPVPAMASSSYGCCCRSCSSSPFLMCHRPPPPPPPPPRNRLH